MLERIRSLRGEEGFTLIELLVAIVILGILSAVVVFAVSGISDRGQTAAGATDRATLRTAQEAYYAKQTSSPVYANEAGLKAGGVLAQYSTLYDVTVGADTTAATSATNAETSSATGAAYVIKVQNASCGTVGSVVS